MKLYTFKWKYGKVEEPLQAVSESQALMILAINIANRSDLSEENARKMVYRAFRNGRLDYELEEPYVPPKKEVKERPKPEPPKDPKYVQSFLDFTKEN